MEVAIASGQHAASTPGPPGILMRTFVSSACGATSFYTGSAVFDPGAVLPFHTHGVSEAITVMAGSAVVCVESRTHRLSPFDCIHVPAGVAHSVRNEDSSRQLIAHSAFAEPSPSRTFLPEPISSRDGSAPETLRRFEKGNTYELAPGTVFCDLFARRFGAVGICGGYAEFVPESSLPCHTHHYDESITIVTGQAVCQVQGSEYRLSDYDTAFVPMGRPHRFLNQSNEKMAMIWVYAGDEPDRVILEAGYCSGLLKWPG